MVKATEGLLIECDPALSQYIRHVDEQQCKDPAKTSFILAILDDSNLLVKEDALSLIMIEVQELQDRNHFAKAAEQDPNLRGRG